jgi:hypothetical protein
MTIVTSVEQICFKIKRRNHICFVLYKYIFLNKRFIFLKMAECPLDYCAVYPIKSSPIRRK